MTRKDYQITEWCRRMIEGHIQNGSFCIDATMGNGNDTEYLCRKAGPDGRVLAFDIQKEAVEHTEKRLKEQIPYENYQLFQESHSHMNAYAEAESADCIMFNLGYLPGGDHQIATKSDTTICALKQGLELLKKNGIMSVCIYSGGDSGFEERDAVMEWLKQLDSRKFLVMMTQYYNRPNHPPIPVFIIKI